MLGRPAVASPTGVGSLSYCLMYVREKDAISSDVRAKKRVPGVILGPCLIGPRAALLSYLVALIE